MIRRGVFFNQLFFISVLNLCCVLVFFDCGKMIYVEVIKLGFENCSFVGNLLIIFYFKCGSILDGVKVFEGIKQRNLVLWNLIIVGCV